MLDRMHLMITLVLPGIAASTAVLSPHQAECLQSFLEKV